MVPASTSRGWKLRPRQYATVNGDMLTVVPCRGLTDCEHEEPPRCQQEWPNRRVAERTWRRPPHHVSAEYAGLLHCVHIGKTSNDLWHSTFNGTVWSPNVKIPNQQSKSPPALAWFDGSLHMVHLGESSNDIWHSMFDGSSWSPNVKIPNQKSKLAPALAVLGARLHMVHLGDSSNDLWHSTFDGTSWSPNIRIADQSSKATPALAVFAGVLHMVHLGDSANDLWHSTFDGAPWSPNVRIKSQASKGAPALANNGGLLQLVHLGSSLNQLWHSIFDGTWRPNVQIENQSVSVSSHFKINRSWCMSAATPPICGTAPISAKSRLRTQARETYCDG